MPTQNVDNFEYELPSDFEDEEINEEAAFTEEDKKLYSDWFSSEGAGSAGNLKRRAEEEDAELLDSGEEGAGGSSEDYNTDDFSEEVLLSCVQS